MINLVTNIFSKCVKSMIHGQKAKFYPQGHFILHRQCLYVGDKLHHCLWRSFVPHLVFRTYIGLQTMDTNIGCNGHILL